MKSVILSTTEAEYVAVSEVVKEIKLLYQLLMSMGINRRRDVVATRRNKWTDGCVH